MSYAKQQEAMLRGDVKAPEPARRLRQRESDDQAAVIAWARMSEGRYPELEALHSTPNGGQRHIAVAARMKREGQLSGVPDLHLPVPRGGYASLYIEMKTDTGRLSDGQKNVGAMLRSYGNCVVVCRGVDEAIATLIAYLSGEFSPGA